MPTASINFQKDEDPFEPAPKIGVGDQVVLLQARRVAWVGYPLRKKDIAEDLLPEIREDIISLLDKAGALVSGRRLDTIIDRITDEIAYLYCAKRGWGGKERSIHFEPVSEEYLSDPYLVSNVRYCVTGTYVPANSGTNYWGEYDYEPAFLDDQKRHKLLHLDNFTHRLVALEEDVMLLSRYKKLMKRLCGDEALRKL